MASMFPFWNHYFQECKKSEKMTDMKPSPWIKRIQAEYGLRSQLTSPIKHETEIERAEVCNQTNTVTRSWRHTPHLLQTRFLISKHSLMGCVPITRGEFTFCTDDYLIPSQIQSLSSTTRDVFPAPPHSERARACVCVSSDTCHSHEPQSHFRVEINQCVRLVLTRADYFPQTPVGLEKPERLYPWRTPEERILCSVSSRLRTCRIVFHPSIRKKHIHIRSETYFETK